MLALLPIVGIKEPLNVKNEQSSQAADKQNTIAEKVTLRTRRKSKCDFSSYPAVSSLTLDHEFKIRRSCSSDVTDSLSI